MKLKLKKVDNTWNAEIWRGNGGISSLTASRHTNSFWRAICVFSLSNFILHYRLVKLNKRLK